MIKMPRWLELQVEIDYLDYILQTMYEDAKRQSPINAMIDKATGYDKKKLRDAKEVIARVKILKKEFYKLTQTPQDQIKK